jgi:Tfp pilus assembly protein PilZ
MKKGQRKKRRRTQERLPCNLDIVINDLFFCKAFDISEGGMYVLTNQVFSPDTIVKISFLFRNEKIEVHTKVKYCHEGVGIGIIFKDLDNALKDIINELVDTMKLST